MSIKIALRTALSATLHLSGWTSSARCHRHKLCIVTFHRVLPAADRASYPYPGLVVTPEELDFLLQYFNARFDCGTLERQYARFQSGEQVTRPLLAITFDDGQYDNFAYARPLLERHNMKATFFIPVRAIESGELLWHDQLGFALQQLAKTSEGRQRADIALSAAGIHPQPGMNIVTVAVREAKKIPLDSRLRLVQQLVKADRSFAPPSYARMMSRSEVATLAGEGHEIGSHSMTHCLMPECTDAALEYETTESRRLLASMTARPVKSFCYPNGDADKRTALAVAAAGYDCAVTTAHGNNDRDESNFLLTRFDMDPARMTNSAGQLTNHGIAFRMAPRARS
jgi:peptidoglycan/xylan/chitin deacetylase (PgdA/CDA1 family)